MVSKNNFNEKLRKMEQKKERFSIRKLSVGAASVLIGLSFLGFNAHTAEAATPDQATSERVAKTSSNPETETKSNIQATPTAATNESVKNSNVTSESNKTLDNKTVDKESQNSQGSSQAVNSQITSSEKQYGINVPKATEPYASKFWQAADPYLTKVSNNDLEKMGLDQNTYFESDTNQTKWHVVSWVTLLKNPIFANQYEELGLPDAIQLGKYERHTSTGTFATLVDPDFIDFQINSINSPDNLISVLSSSETDQTALLVPILKGNMIYVHQGAELSEKDIFKSLKDNSEVTNAEWVTDQEEHGIKVVNTNVTGEQEGAARVTIANGTETSVSIPVTVIGPKGKQTVNVNQGDPAPLASSVITNDQEIQKYFPGTTYSWKETPKTDIPGTFPATVEVKWPDGQTTEVNTAIVVKQMFKVNDENKTVTRTIIDNVPKQDPITVVQKVNLTRKVTTDMSGKFISATDWQAVGTNEWAAYTPKAIAGYTPNISRVAAQVVTGDTQDTRVEINYTANTLNQVVNYVQRGTNKTISTQNVAGKSDSSVAFTAAIPEGWVLDQNSIPSTINFGTSDPAPLTIYIKHGTKAVTDGTSKDVTRTVNYKDPVTGAVKPVTTQRATLTRTGEKDLVTGEITYGPWSTANFDKVTAPTIAGYTVTNPDAAPVMTVTGNTVNSTVTFNYTANDQKQTVEFIDNNDQKTVVSQYDVTGKTNETVKLNITNNVPKNWVIVDPTNVPAEVTLGAIEKAPIKVYIKHGTKEITDGEGTSKDVTRTINYILGDAKDSVTYKVQKATLHRTGTEDLVTGEITYGPWNTANFEQVNAPAIEGYYITSSAVAPAMNVTGNTPNSTVTFVYAASWHNQVVSYVNKKTNELVSTDVVTGRTGSTVQFTPQIPTGWELSSGQTIPNSITFGTTDPKTITIYIQHQTKNIDAGTTKTVTRTIYTQIAGQSPMLARIQNVSLSRPATQDLVTGEITYGAWNTANFDKVTAPTIAGYTVTNPDAAPAMTVNGNTPNTTVVFNYDSNEQSQKIEFVNNANRSDVVGQYAVTGKTGETVNANVQSHIPANWVITPGQTIPATITFGTSENSPIVVYVQHGTKDITNDQTSKTITRTVNLVNPTNGKTENVAKQSVTLTRPATQDLVTGEITYGAWNSSNFNAVNAPRIAGYYSVGNQTAPAMTVTANTPDSTVTFHYAAAWHNQAINFVDNATKTTISGYEVTGKTGETVNANVQSHVPTNWVIVPGTSVPTEITFGANNPAPITIYVQHGTKDITNDQTSKTITRTINVVNPTSGNTEQYTVQTAKLNRPATQDLVTGEITYGAWNSTSFKAVAAPAITGYTVTNPNAAPAMNVTGNTQSSTVTFTYAANEQHATIEYVNVDNPGQIVKTDTLDGKTGQTVSYKAQAPEGWVIVTGQTVPTQLTFGATQMPITKILVRQLQSYKYSVSTNTTFITHVGATINTPSLNPASASFNWTDKNGNPIAAPTGYKVSWKQAPSTSAITQENGTLQITYSDGTTAQVKVPVTVKGATAINGNKVYQGEAAPKARLAVNTRDVDNFGITAMTWSQEPNTNVAGANIPGVVRVDYSDGTHQLVNITVDVIGVKKGEDNKDDRNIYFTSPTKINVISASGKPMKVDATRIYSRDQYTDEAYPVGNPKRVTYSKWTMKVVRNDA